MWWLLKILRSNVSYVLDIVFFFFFRCIMLFNYQTPLHFIGEEIDMCGIRGWKIKSHVTERNLSK